MKHSKQALSLSLSLSHTHTHTHTQQRGGSIMTPSDLEHDARFEIIRRMGHRSQVWWVSCQWVLLYRRGTEEPRIVKVDLGLINVDLNLLRLIRIGFEFAEFWFWFMEMWVPRFGFVFNIILFFSFIYLFIKIDKLIFFYLDINMAFIIIIILIVMLVSSVPTKHTVCHVGNFR